ncbi:nucleotidyltransferase family protein [Maribacter sp. 2304DJ31-5]|uniref:nucleotidyltransferase family protein n=1 Tax=Maribacter sp. 2304DJ31-5 TaxID=3386273 RepID=UPI0039BC50D1
MEKNIAILIMAAGRSSRMQGIKQLLPWRDSNLLLHAIATAKTSNATGVYIVLGANAEKIAQRCKLEKFGVQTIKNIEWKNGLGSSIALGTDHITQQSVIYDGILVMLADQPLLTSNYYDQMIAKFRSGKFKIIATKYNDRAGVPAIFHSSLFPQLKNLSGDTGAKGILRQHYDVMHSIDAGDMNQDIDTKETYSKLYKKYN